MTDREEFEQKLKEDRKVYRQTEIVAVVGGIALCILVTLYKFVW